jgi:hypothetical protein
MSAGHKFLEEKQSEISDLPRGTGLGSGTPLVRSRPIWGRTDLAVVLGVAHEFGVSA